MGDVAPRPDWTAQQLAGFLAAVGSYLDEESALAGAVQRSAIAVESEFAAITRAGRVLASVGFRRGREPAEMLVAIAGDDASTVDVPGTGRCHVARVDVPVDDERLRLLVMRTAAPFGPQDVALLDMLGGVLALALRPLRALEVERTLRHRTEATAAENRGLLLQLQRRQQLLERLGVIERSILQRKPLQTVFDLIAEGAAQVLDHEIAVLRLLEPDDRSVLRLAASVGRPGREHVIGMHRPADVGLVGQAIRSEQIVAVEDYGTSTYRAPDIESLGVRSAMAAPVQQDGRVIGCLVVASRRRRTYGASTRNVLDSFAGHVSMALNDASAMEAMRTAYGEAVHRANHDGLTGLANRSLVSEHLEMVLYEGRGHDVTVLFVDLDRFKSVNDSFGHTVGDRVLVGVAQSLRACVRPGDLVGRLAGDEFVVVAENLQRDEARRMAERITRAVSRPLEVGEDREIVITASVGVTVAADGRDAGEVLRDADVAMYRAKQRGRARIEVFDRAMHTQLLDRVETEQSLRRAIARDELRVHYQPVYRLGQPSPVGVEALVRWERPDVGMVPPDRFIPLAEEVGLIIPIGLWVLRRACRQVARWRAEDPRLADLRVSVNLSARQFGDASLVASIATVLEATGLPAECLGLEITESVLLDDIDATEATLRALRALGVRLSIDDFGTGYSSLSYLKRFPVDEIKIDRSFTAGLVTDRADLAIVQAIIGLADAMDLEVVAEGVETDEQLTRLAELGCRLAQGYLLAHPTPPDQVIALLPPEEAPVAVRTHDDPDSVDS